MHPILQMYLELNEICSYQKKSIGDHHLFVLFHNPGIASGTMLELQFTYKDWLQNNERKETQTHNQKYRCPVAESYVTSNKIYNYKILDSLDWL